MLTTFFEQFRLYSFKTVDGAVLPCVLILDIRDTDFLVMKIDNSDPVVFLDKPFILVRSSIVSAERFRFELNDLQGRTIHEWLANW